MSNVELCSFEEIHHDLETIKNDLNIGTSKRNQQNGHKFVLPGDIITMDCNVIVGPGTYQEDIDDEQEDEQTMEDPILTSVTSGDADQDIARSSAEQPTEDKRLIASLAGIVRPINRFVSVHPGPLRNRYMGASGEIVVGRIVEVQQKQWLVETGSRMHSVLKLKNVNLPGGETRIRNAEDELNMEQYLAIGDLVCAEVQKIYKNGCLGLFTRTLRHGKLGQGTVIQVPPSLVAKRNKHIHHLPCGVYLILGNNGWIFISTTELNSNPNGGYILDETDITYDQRIKMARVRNCLLALSSQRIILDYHSIMASYEISEKLNFNIKDLIMRSSVAIILAEETQKAISNIVINKEHIIMEAFSGSGNNSKIQDDDDEEEEEEEN